MLDRTVLCTLTPAEQAAQRNDLLPGLLSYASDRVELSNGYRLRFEHAPSLLVRIASTIERQRQCCRFLRFTIAIERNLGRITLDVSGEADTKAFLTTLLTPDSVDVDPMRTDSPRA